MIWWMEIYNFIRQENYVLLEHSYMKLAHGLSKFPSDPNHKERDMFYYN